MKPKKVFAGLLTAVLVFVTVGTVTAVWDNPFFIRMTPGGDFELTLLFLLSILSGVYVAIRAPSCSVKKAGVGGVLGFIGIACPVCNKILMLLFGGELLLAYFEPIRVYVAALGVLVVGWAVLSEWKRQRTSGRLEVSP